VAKKRSSCSYKIISFLAREKETYEHIFVHFSLDDLLKIIVTENSDFIQSLIATNTEELPDFNKETVQLNSTTQFAYIDKIDDINKEDLKHEMVNRRKKGKTPANCHIFLTKLPLVLGSDDSIRLHEQLAEL
jgi:hypothetical protein